MLCLLALAEMDAVGLACDVAHLLASIIRRVRRVGKFIFAKTQTQFAGVASEVLELDPMALDPATMNMRSLCKTELAFISNTGTFMKRQASGSLLWSMLAIMARLLYAETQSIEGLNSVVKLLGRRAPNISLELLSSRLTIKRLLGQADGKTGCRKRWRDVKALAEREVMQLSDFSTSCLPVLADAERWAPSGTLPFPLTADCEAGAADAQHVLQDNHNDNDKAKPRTGAIRDLLERGFLPHMSKVRADAVTWAKSYNLGWKWCTGLGKRATSKTKQAHGSSGFGVMILQTANVQEACYYLVVDKFSHSVAFSRLKVLSMRVSDSDDDDLQDCVRWEHDRSSFADSLESSLLFLKYYEICQAGSEVLVQACFLTPAMCTELFREPGFMPVEKIHAHAATMFVLNKERMKGTAAKSKKRKRCPPPRDTDVEVEEAGGKHLPAPHHDAEAAEGDGEDDNDGNADADNIYFQHAELFDTSGSDDNPEEADEENDASGMQARELQRCMQALSASSSKPTVKEVRQTAQQLVDAPGCMATEPELEEEALLLLLRQRNEASSSSNAQPGSRSKSKSGRARSRLAGVGDIAGSSAAAEADSSSGSESDDDPGAGSCLDPEVAAALDSIASEASVGAQQCFACLQSWACASLRRLKSFMEVEISQEGKRLGQNKSISMVLLRSQKVNGCTCARCRWCSESNADIDEVIYVSWLNNSASHGVIGMKARQCNLDLNNRVLYSVADTRYGRTGVASGVGQPEILCDDAHASVLVRWVGAAMKKIRKTSNDRDQVSEACVDVREFCEMMVARLSGTLANGEDSAHTVVAVVDVAWCLARA